MTISPCNHAAAAACPQWVNKCSKKSRPNKLPKINQFHDFQNFLQKNYYILESENGKYQMKSVLFLIILAHYGVGGSSSSKLNLQTVRTLMAYFQIQCCGLLPNRLTIWCIYLIQEKFLGKKDATIPKMHESNLQSRLRDLVCSFNPIVFGPRPPPQFFRRKQLILA